MLRDAMNEILSGDDEQKRQAQVLAGFFAMHGRPSGRTDEQLGIKQHQTRPGFASRNPAIAEALDLSDPK